MLKISKLNQQEVTDELINILYILHKELPLNDQMSLQVFTDELIALRRIYFIATIKNKIIGYVGVLDCIDNYDIIGIAVSLEEQNKCIGSMLLNEIKKLAKANNVNTITLEVDERNIKAINFYKKNGFLLTKIRKNYYNNSDAYEMQFIVK